MKPTLIQRAFADHWIMIGILGAAAIGTGAWAWVFLLPGVERSFMGIVEFVGIVGCTALMGFLCAVVLSPFLFGPLYRFQAWRNGAPFNLGDQVRILSRQHRGQIGRVTWIMHERDTVYVKLMNPGEEHIFSFVEVCRHAATGQPQP